MVRRKVKVQVFFVVSVFLLLFLLFSLRGGIFKKQLAFQEDQTFTLYDDLSDLIIGNDKWGFGIKEGDKGRVGISLRSEVNDYALCSVGSDPSSTSTTPSAYANFWTTTDLKGKMYKSSYFTSDNGVFDPGSSCSGGMTMQLQDQNGNILVDGGGNACSFTTRKSQAGSVEVVSSLIDPSQVISFKVDGLPVCQNTQLNSNQELRVGYLASVTGCGQSGEICAYNPLWREALETSPSCRVDSDDAIVYQLFFQNDTMRVIDTVNGLRTTTYPVKSFCNGLKPFLKPVGSTVVGTDDNNEIYQTLVNVFELSVSGVPQGVGSEYVILPYITDNSDGRIPVTCADNSMAWNANDNSCQPVNSIVFNSLGGVIDTSTGSLIVPVQNGTSVLGNTLLIDDPSKISNAQQVDMDGDGVVDGVVIPVEKRTLTLPQSILGFLGIALVIGGVAGLIKGEKKSAILIVVGVAVIILTALII